MIKIKKFPLGQLEANCYFVNDDESGYSFVIDPGDMSPELEKMIGENGAQRLKYILLTHGHFDHIGYTASLKEKYPDAKIVIGREDSAFTTNDALNLGLYFGLELKHFSADIEVADGDKLDFGKSQIKVISTPGHTKGSVCYILDNNVFTGDTLMMMTGGRTDFPTGSSHDMFCSMKKLYELDGDYNLYCGHGENTNLDFERNNNIFMRNFEDDDIYC